MADNFVLVRVFTVRRMDIEKLQSFDLISNPIQLGKPNESKIVDCYKPQTPVERSV
jgi:hypothetical protein